MNYLVYISLDQFYVSTLRHNDVELSVKPLAIHCDRMIVDACDLAQAIGVRPGMRLGEARTLSPETQFKPLHSDFYVEAQHSWLDVVALYADMIQPAQHHAAYVDLSAHPRPSYIASELHRHLSTHTGLTVWMGVARVKWLAKIGATIVDPHDLHVDDGVDPTLRWELAMLSALDHPKRFLESLPVEAMPVDLDISRRLRFLGCSVVGDVARLPAGTLRSQFGREAAQLSLMAAGGGDATVLSQYPADSVTVSVRFDPPADLAEPIANGVRSLAADLGEKLLRSEKQSYELRVSVLSESGLSQRIRRTFTKPIHSQGSASAALQACIAALAVHEPIARIQVTAPNLTQSRRKQRDLFLPLNTRQTTQHAEAGLEAVKARFGEASILKASELQETRRKKLLRAWKHATGWI